MTFRIEGPAKVPSPAPASAVSPPASKPTSRFAETLAGLGERVDAGEGVMRRAMAGGAGALDAAGLIALQAGVYRYTEAVELVGKLVDRAANGVKTILQPH